VPNAMINNAIINVTYLRNNSFPPLADFISYYISFKVQKYQLIFYLDNNYVLFNKVYIRITVFI